MTFPMLCLNLSLWCVCVCVWGCVFVNDKLWEWIEKQTVWSLGGWEHCGGSKRFILLNFTCHRCVVRIKANSSVIYRRKLGFFKREHLKINCFNKKALWDIIGIQYTYDIIIIINNLITSKRNEFVCQKYIILKIWFFNINLRRKNDFLARDFPNARE